MDQRDLEKEQLLGDIIRAGGDPLSYLNDTDYQEGEDDGSGDPTMEEEGDHDGSGDRMAEEGDHDHGSGDRTEEGASTVSKSDEVRRRGPKKRLRPDERFTITEVAKDGQPIAPKRTKDAFVHQCGVVVRDYVSINTQQWNKNNKDPEVSYVHDRLKDDLWTELMTNFSLPREEDPNNPVIERKVKAFALKKMAELFRNWKKELNTKFVEKEETPKFVGRYEKIRD
jgi:hypothetical protein